MLGKFVLLICALALLSPVVLLSGGNDRNADSDTQRSIRVVIRHCTS